MMKHLLTMALLVLGLSGLFLWAGATPAKAQWCQACDLTGGTSKCQTDPYTGVTTCTCVGGSGSCGANCPSGYYPCNITGNGGACCPIGGGGGNPRCRSVQGYKVINPSGQAIEPASSQVVTLTRNGVGDMVPDGYPTPQNPYWFRDGYRDADNQFVGNRMPVGWYNESVTVPAGYSAEYNISNADYGSGSGTGSTTRDFHCDSNVNVWWYFTPYCTVTAPIGSFPVLTPTTAALSWTHGTGGTSQRIRMDANKTQVETGCPGGCKVSASGDWNG